MTDPFSLRQPDEVDEADELDAPEATIFDRGSLGVVREPVRGAAPKAGAAAARPLPRVWWATDGTMVIAVGLVTGIGIVDYAFRNVAVLLGLLIVGPLVAATGTTPRRTAYVAAYALALAVLLGVPAEIIGTLDHAIRCSVVAVAGGLSVWAAGLRAAREDAMRRVAHVAEVAQRAILRPPPPELGSVAFAARYLSASEEALIGGDLYETAY